MSQTITYVLWYDVTTKGHTVLLVFTHTLIIDHVAGKIIRLVASVCVSVRLSVSTLLFEPFDLDFWHEGRP